MPHEAGASPRHANPKTATQVVHEALSAFEGEYRMIPLVILLPTKIFLAYEREAIALAGLLPPGPTGTRGAEWADVRVVEHEALKEIEVY